VAETSALKAIVIALMNDDVVKRLGQAGSTAEKRQFLQPQHSVGSLVAERLPNAQSRALTMSTREWTRVLAQYREPDQARSIVEIFITVGPLIVLWLLAWAARSMNYVLTLAIAVPAGCFLIRLFMVQHDCGRERTARLPSPARR
jgi:hypothetical protein